MGVIREICDKVAVLDQGKIIESGSVFEVFAQPRTEIAHDFVSTVMHDEIPESVHQLIQTQQSTSQIYRIVFVGNSAGTPLLSQIAKRFDVEVNVLFGSITELQEIPFGNLIVKFEGEAKEINRVLMFINQQEVTIKEILADVS
jgi:D-methionine transport system ATP-binding protein